MAAIDDRTRRELERLCRQFGATRLELFGSATGPAFDEATSDPDFLVELDPRAASAPPTPGSV